MRATQRQHTNTDLRLIIRPRKQVLDVLLGQRHHSHIQSRPPARRQPEQLGYLRKYKEHVFSSEKHGVVRGQRVELCLIQTRPEPSSIIRVKMCRISGLSTCSEQEGLVYTSSHLASRRQSDGFHTVSTAQRLNLDLKYFITLLTFLTLNFWLQSMFSSYLLL